MKYKVSNKYTVESVPQKFGESINGYNWMLCDNTLRKRYVITDSMKYILDQFQDMSDLGDIYKRIATDTKSSVEEVKNVTSGFIDIMIKRKFITNAGQKDKIIEGNIDEAKLKAGDVFEGFIIQDVVQVSRKGAVYKATAQDSGDMLIIKTLAKEKINKDKLEREELRLKQEFEISTVVNRFGEYFIRPVRISTDKVHSYAVYEYFDSVTLQKFLSENRSNLTKKIVLKLIKQILHAFSVIHEHKIYHGDIHSKNILVDDNYKIKIIDFGLSNHENFELDEVINNGGMHFFCPPERIGTSMYNKFVQRTSYHAEVYQIGVIIYLVLYGKIPFRGFTWRELSTDIKTRDFDYKKHKAYPSLHIESYIKPVLEKALDKIPDKRFDTATEFYNEILKIDLFKR